MHSNLAFEADAVRQRTVSCRVRASRGSTRRWAYCRERVIDPCRSINHLDLNYPRRMSRMSYRTILFLPLLLLSGCVTSFPEGIPTATIRFTSNVPVIIKPICGRDNFIKQGLIKNDYLSEVSPVKMYGTRSDKNNEVIERLIPAERTLPFRVRWGTPQFPFQQ